MKQEFLEKANKIISDSYQGDKYQLRCVQANICPECGSSISKKLKPFLSFLSFCKVYKISCTNCDYDTFLEDYSDNN